MAHFYTALYSRKIIIFTEPKDTLEYLADKIRTRLGAPEAVVVIHGGVAREQRRAAIAAFNDDPTVRVLIANDAAGEGVNEDGVYRGLTLGKAVTVRFDGGAVLVRREAAEAQIRAATPSVTAGDGGMTLPGGLPHLTPNGSPRDQAAARALRRFYGSVDLDPNRPVRDLQPIIDSVISELMRADGVKLTLRLEIEATAPEGFKAEDAAVVRDNARTLKFRAEATGFSED